MKYRAEIRGTVFVEADNEHDAIIKAELLGIDDWSWDSIEVDGYDYD